MDVSTSTPTSRRATSFTPNVSRSRKRTHREVDPTLTPTPLNDDSSYDPIESRQSRPKLYDSSEEVLSTNATLATSAQVASAAAAASCSPVESLPSVPTSVASSSGGCLTCHAPFSELIYESSIGLHYCSSCGSIVTVDSGSGGPTTVDTDAPSSLVHDGTSTDLYHNGARTGTYHSFFQQHQLRLSQSAQGGPHSRASILRTISAAQHPSTALPSTSDQNEAETTTPWTKTITEYARKAQSEVVKRLHTLLTTLHLPHSLANQAILMLQKVTGISFQNSRHTDIMLGVCVYILCRNENRPLNLLDIADLLSVDLFRLGRELTKILQANHMHLSVMDPSVFIERLLSDLNTHLNQELDLTLLAHLRTDTNLLLKFMRRDWLLPGRNPAILCTAAMAIVIEAHQVAYPLETLNATLRHSLSTLKARVRELKVSLFELATKIMPWLDESDGSKRKKRKGPNMDVHLPFIMENLHLLMQADDEMTEVRDDPNAIWSSPITDDSTISPISPTSPFPLLSPDSSRASSSTSTVGVDSSFSANSTPISTQTTMSFPSDVMAASISSKPSPPNFTRSAVSTDPPSFKRSVKDRCTRLRSIAWVVRVIEVVTEGAMRFDLTPIQAEYERINRDHSLMTDLSTTSTFSFASLNQEELAIATLLLRGDKLPVDLIDMTHFTPFTDTNPSMTSLVHGSAVHPTTATASLMVDFTHDLNEHELDGYVRSLSEAQRLEELKASMT